MRDTRQQLIEQLSCELGNSEDTALLLDWLEDAWGTLDLLRERFGEPTATQLYLASPPLLRSRTREPEKVTV